jgi:tetrahydromethanopterin S-methyltransferase subunit G
MLPVGKVTHKYEEVTYRLGEIDTLVEVDFFLLQQRSGKTNQDQPLACG